MGPPAYGLIGVGSFFFLSAAVDYVFFAASPQLLLVATMLLRGRRWHVVPWCFVIASALGAAAIAVAVSLLGEASVAGSGDRTETVFPAWIAEGIAAWGLLALFVLCALPVSMRSPVFVMAL